MVYNIEVGHSPVGENPLYYKRKLIFAALMTRIKLKAYNKATDDGFCGRYKKYEIMTISDTVKKLCNHYYQYLCIVQYLYAYYVHILIVAMIHITW